MHVVEYDDDLLGVIAVPDPALPYEVHEIVEPQVPAYVARQADEPDETPDLLDAAEPDRTGLPSDRPWLASDRKPAAGGGQRRLAPGPPRRRGGEDPRAAPGRSHARPDRTRDRDPDTRWMASPGCWSRRSDGRERLPGGASAAGSPFMTDIETMRAVAEPEANARMSLHSILIDIVGLSGLFPTSRMGP